MRYKPSQSELFAKHSSLAIAITKETKYDFEFHVYNRRTNRIIYRGKIPMMTMRSFMDCDKIPPRKSKQNQFWRKVKKEKVTHG